MSEPQHPDPDAVPPGPGRADTPREKRLEALEERIGRIEAHLWSLHNWLTAPDAAHEPSPDEMLPPTGPAEPVRDREPVVEPSQADLEPDDTLAPLAGDWSDEALATETPAGAGSDATGHGTSPILGPAARDGAASASAGSSWSAPPGSGTDLEKRIGQIWVSRAGLVLVLIALAMFLKWAYDRSLISYPVRTALGLLLGLSLVSVGEILHRRGERFFEAFTGAGIAAFYATFFAAYNLYHLFGQVTTFSLMVATTAAAVAFAIRYDAAAIAGVGLAGGFAVPYLLPGPSPRLEGMLVYYLILVVGLLLTIPRLSRFREPLLILTVLAGFLAVAVPAGAGVAVHAEMWLAYLLVLSIAVGLFAYRWRDGGVLMPQPLVWALSALPFVTVLAGPDDAPFLTLGYLMVVFVGVSWLAGRIDAGTPLPRSLAVVAVSMALAGSVPSGDDAAWWLMAVVLVAGLTVATTARGFRAPSYSLLGFCTAAGLFIRDRLTDPSFGVDAVFPVVMLVLILASGLLRRAPNAGDLPLLVLGALIFGGDLWVRLDVHDLEIYQGTLMIALALIFAAAAGLAGIVRQEAPILRLALAGLGVVCLTIFFPAQFDTVTTTAAWAVEALMLAFIGFRLNNGIVWRSSVGVLLLAAGRYVLFDAHLPRGLTEGRPFADSHTVAAAFLLICGLLLAARLARAVPALTARDRTEAEQAAGFSFLLANAVLLVGITLEFDLLFDQLEAGPTARGGRFGLSEVKQFVLTATYAMHSMALVAVGVVRALKPVRILGLTLFGATLAKVVLIDLSFLDTIYRVFSFLALGGLLVAASFLYRRIR